MIALWRARKQENTMIKKQEPKRRYNILPRLFPLFLIFMAAVSGTYLALQLFGRDSDANPASRIPQIVTVEIIITATPDPSRQQIALTATSLPGQVELPADLTIGDTSPNATIDPARLNAVGLGSSAPNAQRDETVLPTSCIFHSVVSGDTVSGLAQQYGVNYFLMLDVNNLTEAAAAYLQIGDTLLVPLEGCATESQSTATPSSPSGSAAASGDAAPTMTLASPAETAQIEIIEVEGIGDITAEGVRLRNIGGDAINLTAWNLTAADGSSFSFPEFVLFSNAEITLYTRSGADTGDTLFWGKDQPVWQDGDVLTLTDSAGQVQASIRIREIIELE